MEQHGRGSIPGRFSELIKTKIKPPEVNWKSWRTVFSNDVAGQLQGSADLLANTISWLASNDAVGVGNSGSGPAREWTPRQTALVLLVLLCSAAALAAVAVRVSRRRSH